MKYRNTSSTLGSQYLWEDYPGTDDSQIHRLLAIENGRLTDDEAVEEIKAEKGWFDE